MVLRKSSRQRTQRRGGPTAGGLDETEKNQCGCRRWHEGDSETGQVPDRGDFTGPSERLGFAVGRMRMTCVLKFSKANSGRACYLLSGRRASRADRL